VDDGAPVVPRRQSFSTREADGSIRLEYEPVEMGPYVPMERKY
jgi:hypothetical protein